MRLDDLDPSRNTRDLGRGSGGGFRSGFRGGGGGLGMLFQFLPLLLRSKFGWVIIVIGVAAYFLFSGGLQCSSAPVDQASSGTAGETAASSGNEACDTEAELFACRVLTSTEQTWSQLFQQQGRQYAAPTLNFYEGRNSSGCGAADARMGPFYCPADSGIYLDTSFFREMETQMQAGGDFAYAYVIAHEVGHHIQYLTGTANDVRRRQQRASQTEGNQLQVRMELQADCYAGVWAARNRDRIEPGDIEEGMRAANAIGDDTLQRQAQGYVVEDSFTHGSSEQRMRWLRRGLKSGDPAACDTFAARSL